MFTKKVLLATKDLSQDMAESEKARCFIFSRKIS